MSWRQAASLARSRDPPPMVSAVADLRSSGVVPFHDHRGDDVNPIRSVPPLITFGRVTPTVARVACTGDHQPSSGHTSRSFGRDRSLSKPVRRSTARQIRCHGCNAAGPSRAHSWRGANRQLHARQKRQRSLGDPAICNLTEGIRSARPRRPEDERIAAAGENPADTPCPTRKDPTGPVPRAINPTDLGRFTDPNRRLAPRIGASRCRRPDRKRSTTEGAMSIIRGCAELPTSIPDRWPNTRTERTIPGLSGDSRTYLVRTGPTPPLRMDPSA